MCVFSNLASSRKWGGLLFTAAAASGRRFWMNKATTLAAAVWLGSSALQAATITQQLGTRLLKDGIPVVDGQFLTPSDFTGDVSPFDVLLSDDSISNFSAGWTHNHGAVQGTIVSARIEYGIWDLDSAAAGNQVKEFYLNQIALGQMVTVVESRQTQSNIYSIISLNLPSSTFAGLSNGSANVFLSLQNGMSIFALPTTFNGAVLDYSLLTIVTEDIVPPPPGVPEPGGWALMLAGFGGVGVALRRARKPALLAQSA